MNRFLTLEEKQKGIEEVYTKPYSRMTEAQWRQIFHICQQGPKPVSHDDPLRLIFIPWKQRYDNSHVWAEKRSIKIASANGICEVCGINEAKQVHHFTYDRCGREKMEDLQAICTDCHYGKHKNKSKLALTND